MPFSHTPTPWYLCTNVICSTSLPEDEYVVAGEWEGQMIPCMHEGDIEFIVRACNAYDGMLESLKRCVQALEANGAPNCEAAKEARGAILYAEGEQS